MKKTQMQGRVYVDIDTNTLYFADRKRAGGIAVDFKKILSI